MGEPRADRPLDAPGRGSVRGKGVLAWRSRLVPTGQAGSAEAAAWSLHCKAGWEL